MNFQQLSTVLEAVRHDCDLGKVAQVMHSTQSAVGRQIRELERELGVMLFVRTGKRFGGLTTAGVHIFPLIERVIANGQDLKQSTHQLRERQSGPLTVAATHSQGRYVLPPVVAAFRASHPEVNLNLCHGSAEQVADMLVNGQADIAIASEALDRRPQLISFACRAWRHLVLVPPGHPLLFGPLTLDALARYPLITYDAGSSGRAAIDKAFAELGLATEVVVATVDADIVKSYVALGLGVGIVSSLSFNAARDTDLRAIDTGSMFGAQFTRIGLRHDRFVRAYTYAFIETFAPSLDRASVASAFLDAQLRR